MLWPNYANPLQGGCPHHCCWRWFLFGSFQAELSGCWKFKHLLWVWLQSARGLREVHSASWDPWWVPVPHFWQFHYRVMKGLTCSSFSLFQSHQVFLIMAGKEHQLKHMRSSDTKVLTASFHLYILMTKLDLLQLLLVGFRMASIQINSEQCWGNRYVIRAVSVCWILHGSWGIQSLHFSFLSPVQWKGNSGQQRVMSKELDSSFFYAWEKFLKPYRIRIMLFSTKSASLLTTAKHWVFNPSFYPIPLCNLPDKSKQSILLVDPSYPSWEIKRCKTPPWDPMEFRREIMNTC